MQPRFHGRRELRTRDKERAVLTVVSLDGDGTGTRARTSHLTAAVRAKRPGASSSDTTLRASGSDPGGWAALGGRSDHLSYPVLTMRTTGRFALHEGDVYVERLWWANQQLCKRKKPEAKFRLLGWKFNLGSLD